MTQPAAITSEYDWNQLVANLRLIGDDIRRLRDRVTTDETDLDDLEEEPVTSPDYHLDPDPPQHGEHERLERLDAETDGDLDGDYDHDDPQLEA